MSTTGNTSTTFSSAHMRQRDKVVREKHDQELLALHSKVNKLRYSNDDLRKQIHDVEERATRISNALGFKDFIDAQVFISTADQDVSYRKCFEQVDSLRAELEVANVGVKSLEEQLELAHKKRKELEANLEVSIKLEQEASSEVATFKLEISELRKRYDELQNKHGRATEFYKADYKRWRQFKTWLFSDDEHDKNSRGIMRKKRKLQEMLESDCLKAESVEDKAQPPPLGGITNPYLAEDQNQATSEPVPNSQPRPFLVSPLVLSPSATLTSSIAPSKAKTDSIPLRSPSVFLDLAENSTSTCRGSIMFRPVTPKVLPSLLCSSETEQDSSSPLQHPNVALPTPLQSAFKAPKIQPLACSSDTEPDTQRQYTSSPDQHHNTPSPTPPTRFLPAVKVSKVPTSACSAETNEVIPQASSPVKHYNGPLPTPKSLVRPLPIVRPGKRDVTGTEGPPSKIRRVDAMQTPKYLNSPCRLKLSPHSGSSPRAISRHHFTRRGKNNENKENVMLSVVSTPINAADKGSTTPLQNYSAFKGRGRYAKSVVNSTIKTINAEYAIDSSRNGGVEHPYDEVVRRKEDRKRMDAGDCECCHEYYEAVGPLPPRMQPPLWRSPEAKKNKTLSANCKGQHKRHASDSHALSSGKKTFIADTQDLSFSNTSTTNREIENHKKLISRHRHHWARAATPPGYWDIGFPSTQEAEKINERAEEMHRKKQIEVDSLVRAGEGRYRRR